MKFGEGPISPACLTNEDDAESMAPNWDPCCCVSSGPVLALQLDRLLQLVLPFSSASVITYKGNYSP